MDNVDSSGLKGSFIPSTSLDLLKQLDNAKGRRLRNAELCCPNFENSSTSSHRVLTTARVMKLAKERLLQIKTKEGLAVSMIAVCGFEAQSEASEDLELAFLLQAAAEKVANQQWFQAEKLLTLCNLTASWSGNPVQRVVYYFAEGLRERIHWGCGISLSEEFEKLKIEKAMDVRQAEIQLHPETIKCQHEIPIRLASESAGIQAILEALGSSKRVHLIDFGINNGSHWTLLMQHFSDPNNCPLEILKITAVGSSNQILETAGNQLLSFAKSLNLPFSFLTVISELKELSKDLFDIQADEAVAVYSEYRLSTLLPWLNHLEALIRVVRNLKPCLMVIKEIEATLNTGDFLERFDESLLLYSALFEMSNLSLEHRIMQDSFQQMISNIIAKEGSQRVIRFERVTFWRKFLTKSGMIETDFSCSSISQANILLRSSSKFGSCTLNINGKSLIFGWDGTSILSLSAWKFQDL